MVKVLVVTAGASKAQAVASVRAGDTPPVPVVRAEPREISVVADIGDYAYVGPIPLLQAWAHASDGRVHFYVDYAAAGTKQL